jgi:hypothetical protein
MVLRLVLFVAILLVSWAAGALVYGLLRWHTNRRDVRRRLLAARQAGAPAAYDPRQVEDLPPPVRRYFHQVLKPGQPLITTARITTAGLFSLGEVREDWRPFRAEQLFTVLRPGFHWDARIRMAPAVTAFVRDGYVAGAGILHAEALALIPVADAPATPELAQGELLRHLAESVWFPTALLPGQVVTWEAIDDATARATLVDGDVSVWLDFHFGPDGLIASAHTPTRYGTFGGTLRPTPWHVRYADYQPCEGMLVPMAGEVEWQLPEGALPYWRGRITRIAYEYTP